MEQIIILVLVIITAVAFDFTNGFHDTANAMATSVATGALKPKVAVGLSAVLNLAGAFLSMEVAKTVGGDVVNLDKTSGHALMLVVFCGLVGGIIWNLLTWLLGIPSSSSHSLFGGLIGAALAMIGVDGVKWIGVIVKVIIPALASPIIAGLVAALATWIIYKITGKMSERKASTGFRWGQIGTASLVSLAHGTNDAQKTMGVIFLALVASGSLSSSDGVPLWVKIVCALAIAVGTYTGGWRVIRTLGKGLVEISPRQGLAAEASSAVVILSSSHLGMPLSTTHVATGSIMGTGVGKPGGYVRWHVALRMVIAWLTTMPAAAIVGAVCVFIARLLPDLIGVGVVFAILLLISGAIYFRSLKNAVTHDNVNYEWNDESSIGLKKEPEHV